MSDQMFTDEDLELPFEADPPATSEQTLYNTHTTARELPDILARWQVKNRAALPADQRTIYQGLGLTLLGTSLLAQKTSAPKLPAMLDAWLTQAYEEYDLTDDTAARHALQSQILAKVSRYQTLVEPLLTEAERQAEGFAPYPDGTPVSWTWDGDPDQHTGTVMTRTTEADGTWLYRIQADHYSNSTERFVEISHQFLTRVDDPEMDLAETPEAAGDDAALFTDEPDEPAAEAVIEGEAAEVDEPEAAVEPLPNPGKPAFTTTTSVKYDPKAEPQVAGQYTINVHLVINPQVDGKRIVAINLSSHGLTPVMHAGVVGAKLWADLPGLIAQYQTDLPAHAARKGQPKPTPASTPARTAGTPVPKPQPKAKKTKTAPASKVKPAPPQLFT